MTPSIVSAIVPSNSRVSDAYFNRFVQKQVAELDVGDRPGRRNRKMTNRLHCDVLEKAQETV